MTRRLEDSLIALFRQTLQEAKAGGYNTPSGYVALDATDPQLFPPRYYSSREAEFLAHESVEALGADALQGGREGFLGVIDGYDQTD